MYRIILFAYAVAIGLETGAGLFTSMVVFPRWTASPEAVIGWRPDMPYFMQEGDFFMFSISATTLLALAICIVASRLPANVRSLALGSALSFLLVAVVTAAYVIPVQGRVTRRCWRRTPSGGGCRNARTLRRSELDSAGRA